MTHAQMQQIILDNIAEQLSEQSNIRERIAVAFGVWFRGLLLAGAVAAPDVGADAPGATTDPPMPDAGGGPPV